jgi:hypothetical protein
MLRPAIVTLFLTVAAACGGDDGTADGGEPPLTEVEEIRPGGEPLPGFDECVVTTARHVSPSRDHFPPCSDIAYPVHPPASGDHYDRWADFRIYDQPVPTGFLVHALEHGAVIFNYDCPSGCPEVIAAFDGAIADHGVDPACDGVDARFIVAPDPDLEAPIAITAWERVYTATCLDEESLLEFVETHYAQGPEDLCARGFDGEERGNWCE